MKVVKVILIIPVIWRHHDALCDRWRIIKDATSIFRTQQFVN